ncbi:hypothetical protein BD560DRAFT_400815 [Blakeslea trispora]|nr:hypothetical protein BD560DRAFT_400815 [Blakeslea trispora]
MYTNWKAQTPEILKELRWYSVTQLINYLHQARSYILSQQQPSRRIPPLLTCTKFPAGKEERFPLHDCYVCESIGKWHSKLDLIQLNLQSIMDERQPIEKIGSIQIETLQLINDLLVSFERRTDTLTRTQFEARYQLSWQEDVPSDRSTIYCKNPLCYYLSYLTLVFNQIVHLMSSIKPRVIKKTWLNVSS